MAEKYFTTEGDSVAVYFRSTDAVPVDFSDPQIQVCELRAMLQFSL